MPGVFKLNPRAFVIKTYFSSTGNLDRNHSRQPPLRAYTFVYPFFNNFCAILALVYSSGHAQYNTKVFSFGYLSDHVLKAFGSIRSAPFILNSDELQSRPSRVSKIETDFSVMIFFKSSFFIRFTFPAIPADVNNVKIAVNRKIIKIFVLNDLIFSPFSFMVFEKINLLFYVFLVFFFNTRKIPGMILIDITIPRNFKINTGLVSIVMNTKMHIPNIKEHNTLINFFKK